MKSSSCGARDWIRTNDLRFTKPLLYQLSYPGSECGRIRTYLMVKWIYSPPPYQIGLRTHERMDGIEPTASAWKAEVLPLYDTRRARDWTRTNGLRFTKPLLYHLSYSGVADSRIELLLPG